MNEKVFLLFFNDGFFYFFLMFEVEKCKKKAILPRLSLEKTEKVYFFLILCYIYICKKGAYYGWEKRKRQKTEKKCFYSIAIRDCNSNQ